MAVETAKSRSASVKVENGTDTKGNTLFATVSLAALSKDRWDANKYLAIVTALEPCLSKTVSSAETTVTSIVTADS